MAGDGAGLDATSRTIGRRDGTLVAGATAVSAATSYVVLAVSARTLLPAELNTQFVTFWSALFACFGVLTGLALEATRAAAVTAAAPAAQPDGTGATGRPAGPRPAMLLTGLALGATGAVVLGATSPAWAGRLLPTGTGALTALLCAAVLAYAGHSVVGGALAGTRRWAAYAALVLTDALVRCGLVVGALVLVGTVPAAAGAAVVATATWCAVLLVSPQARVAARAGLDTGVLTFARRVLAAAVAAGSSALLVVGFAVLLAATTPPDEYRGAAPLLLAVTLTRAPLMVPLTAFQGVAVTHFVAHRARGLRALAPIARVVGAVGLVGTAGAWALGPWLLQLFAGPTYRLDGGTLAGLTAAATLLALLTLTGALCQALARHRAFVGGWLVAVAVALVVLAAVPAPMAVRTVVALATGPLAGLVVHLAALRDRDEAAARTAPGVDPRPVAPDRPRVSVCMATYQGAAHVEEQLRSVLDQLGPDDEVVVVDDASTDGTPDRVRAAGDPRVRVVEQPVNRGYVRTFEAALRSSSGDVVLLCDQDDVWTPDHVDVLVAALASADVVATNLATLGGPARLAGPYGQRDWHLRAADSRRGARNVLGILAGNRPYYGCAMGLRRTSLDVVLPFPELLTESHDLWIALYGNLAGSMAHVETRSVLRRFHEGNASSPRPRGVGAVLRSRLMLARCVGELRRRLRTAGTPVGASGAPLR